MTISHVPPNPTTLTWTGVRTLRECPLAFERRFVERLRAMAGVELERGSGVHEVLHDLGVAEREGREVSPAELTKLIERRAALLVDEAAADLREIVRAVVARGILPTFPSDATDVGFERLFAITAEGTECEWDSPAAVFRSIWDQVYRENGGTQAVVRDFKTSRIIENPADQMRLYAYAAACVWPDVEEVVVELHYVRYGAVRSDVLNAEVLRESAPAELAALREDVIERAQHDRWEPRISDACRTCGFRESCPAMTAPVVPLRIVRNADEARAAADQLAQLRVQEATLDVALRAWCESHGPVELGGEAHGFTQSESDKVVDAAEAARLLEARGVDNERLWQSLSLTKAELQKLVTKAIAEAPKKEKGEAREALWSALRDAGAVTRVTTTKFRRFKKDAVNPDEDAA